MFGELTVAVLNNSAKTPLFSVEERVNMLQKVCSGLDNVHIDSFSGLTADYAREKGMDVIIRGLRAITDFEYELQMAQTNKKLLPEVDSVFLSTSLEYAYLSSSIVREVASYGGDIRQFVPDAVAEKIYERFKSI